MSIKLIFFDMDGVLIESVDAKTEAFRLTFSQYPESVDTIISYHLQNLGISRFQKIPHIFEKILLLPLDEQTEDKIFTELSENLDIVLKDVPLVKGCLDVLQRYSCRIPCVVVSAAPESDVRDLLEQKGIARFFCTICGSPKTKSGHMREILKFYRINPYDTLMVGDTIADYYAAQEAGCRFIGRIREGFEDPFSQFSGIELIINDLSDLMTYLSVHQ